MVEVGVPVVPIVLGAFIGVLASFPVLLDRSVLAFLSLCWPFAVVVAFSNCHVINWRRIRRDSLLVPD